jgi:hypothetical protein
MLGRRDAPYARASQPAQGDLRSPGTGQEARPHCVYEYAIKKSAPVSLYRAACVLPAGM